VISQPVRQIDYMHPVLPVVTADPTAMARCQLDRPSAPRTYISLTLKFTLMYIFAKYNDLS
jgi:hypothetical protein